MSKKIVNQVDKFQRDLLTWFDENKRTLPWRLTNNPYYIWISEVMLQQTQVDTVIPYYERFIRQFPTPYSLANASQEEIYKAWEGLGYYSRARNLHQGVREVVEQYNGSVPDNKKEILDIKGIGPYTAGAILSIAYGQKEPAVDGNVMRVLSRIMLIDDDIMVAKTRRQFESILYDMIPSDDASNFNQGLMELGALVCKPKNPSCNQCPVSSHCDAYKNGVQENYPIKKKKKPPKPVNVAVAILSDDKGRYLIEKRPETGLLASMWSFPTIEYSKDKPLEASETFLKEKFGIDTKLKDMNFSYRHTFSHIKWHIQVFEGNFSHTSLRLDENITAVVDWQELKKYPFPTPHQKIIKSLIRDSTDKAHD